MTVPRLPLLLAGAAALLAGLAAGLERAVALGRPAGFRYDAALLHLSLALRVAGDLAAREDFRAWGGLANAATIVLFVISVVATAAANSTPRPLRGRGGDITLGALVFWRFRAIGGRYGRRTGPLHRPRGLALAVGSACIGSSGHQCLGYWPLRSALTAR